MAKAIFGAVQGRQITYVSPPTSYETTGQKVRFTEQIWLARQGACLDLTLLFASALEAAGLHPIVCVEKGHAYVGCWLLEDRLPQCAKSLLPILRGPAQSRLRSPSLKKSQLSPQSPMHPIYQVAVIPFIDFDKDRLFDVALRTLITSQIERVLETEAPISVSLLVSRIRTAWGFGRGGAKIEQAVLAAIPHSVQRRRGFLWRMDQNPGAFTTFRADTQESETCRDLDDIAPEEQAAAMAWLVERFIRVPEDDLLRETTAVFGRKIFTESARMSLKSGLNVFLSRGYRRDEDGQISRA